MFQGNVDVMLVFIRWSWLEMSFVLAGWDYGYRMLNCLGTKSFVR